MTTPRTSVLSRRTAAAGLMATLFTIASSLTTDAVASAATGEVVRCTGFSNDKILETSSRWARARYQICVSASDSRIRPYIQLQFDAPTGCTLSVGFPPSASGSCSKRAILKHPQVYVTDLSIPVRITIGKKSWLRRCHDTNMGWTGLPRYSRYCAPLNFPRVAGKAYKVEVPGLTIDIKDDGKGPVPLTPGGIVFTPQSAKDLILLDPV